MSRFDELDPPLGQENGRNNKGFMHFFARSDPFLKHINKQDRRYNRQKATLQDLIRGVYDEPEETGKKGLKDLIVSVTDLKSQMPPLSDYSIKTNNTPQLYQGNSLENAVSLAPQSEFVSPIDMPSQDEAEQQQKDAMNYIAELNRGGPAPEQLQGDAPLNEEEALSEEGALQANDKPEQAVNGEAEDFFQRLVGGNGDTQAHDKYSASGLWDRFKNSEFSERLMDSFAGLASGQTPQESFSNAALKLRQGNSERAQRQQILKVLQSKGYSDQEAQAIAQNPDLATKIMSDTLSPTGLQEGYRILTPEEKEAHGLPGDMAYQISTQTGKIEPLKGTQRTDDPNNMLSRPELGHMYVKDENGNIRSVLIPGSDAERKRIDEENKKKVEFANKSFKAEQFIGMVEKLQEKLDKNHSIVGFLGYWESLIPGTPASQFKSMLNVIKANIAIDRLMQMKDLAPNGASGFGNLSNVEFMALQNSIAALEQDLSPEQMKESFQTIIDTYKKANKATRILLFSEGEVSPELVQEAYGIEAYKNQDKAQQTQDEQPRVTEYTQFDTLPEGYAFLDSDNRVRRKQSNG
ncbi:hypothetical protein [Bartonella sp. WD12.1]|uniref:hypothetical protein n=1 Tax=Bartonella sp. WD12.1 TaxID=1933903 RepID=UPI000999F809|nr:hypothetical protein [Bartonella sp. WD12.1]OPB29488.1 hypothetical protein BWD121_005080 [Bartonella sp. WD12.1]OPB29642.1 hypothetical protein BWD121_006640 [Bartonella sp. WD12.1]